MAAIPTTEQALQGLAPAPGKAQSIWRDAKIGGLVLIVGKVAKSWALDYRALDGKRRMHKLGMFPGMGLAAARRAAEAHRAAIAKGADPRAEHVAYKAAETVGEALDRWLAMHVATMRTAKETRRRIEHDIRPSIGSVRLPDLSARHLTAVLDQIMLRGAGYSANRCLDVLASFTGWLHRRGEIGHDPAARMADPTKERPRERALTDHELAILWRALDVRASAQAKLAIRLLILTGRRTEEVTGMAWPELDLDIGIWTLAGGRNKSGRPWVFPLAAAVVAMLQERWEALGRPVDGHVFRGKRARGREPTPTTAIVARAKPALDGEIGPVTEPVLVNPWQVRDLRRTARTGWSRLGVMPHIAEMMLGHTVKGLTAVYDQHRYLPELRAGFELWACHVLGLIGDPAGGKVRPIRIAG